MTAAGWLPLEPGATAAELFAAPFPAPPARTVLLAPPVVALALGSTQSVQIVDRAALEARGVELVQRRSGGGAVLLDGDSTVWIDVFLPRDDVRWHDDVHRSFHWLGRVWIDALSALGLAGTLHDGPMRRTPFSDLVCFAGLGPGEVTVGGRKAVGISQRRTREGARYQCAVISAAAGAEAGVAAEIADVLLVPDELGGRPALREHLRATVCAVPATAAEIRSAFLAALPG